ncbi:hypothetical protein B0T17DRAFT_468863, partial [Bombardia bombarda]
RPGRDLNAYYSDSFPPTFLRHTWYRDYDQYPKGVTDRAKAHILGGVVLFDRREPDSTPDVEISLR